MFSLLSFQRKRSGTSLTLPYFKKKSLWLLSQVLIHHNFFFFFKVQNSSRILVDFSFSGLGINNQLYSTIDHYESNHSNEHFYPFTNYYSHVHASGILGCCEESVTPLFAFEMINCTSIASHFLPVSQVNREHIPEHFSKIIGLLSPMHFWKEYFLELSWETQEIWDVNKQVVCEQSISN